MKYLTIINEQQYEIEVLKDGSVLVNGEPRAVDFQALGPSLYSVIRENSSFETVIEERNGQIEVLLRGRLYAGKVLDERAQLMASRRGGLPVDSGEISIKSPMPGLIAAVPVEEGQEVEAGQTVEQGKILLTII